MLFLVSYNLLGSIHTTVLRIRHYYYYFLFTVGTVWVQTSGIQGRKGPRCMRTGWRSLEVASVALTVKSHAHTHSEAMALHAHKEHAPHDDNAEE